MLSKYRPYPRAEDCKRWLNRFQGKYNKYIPEGLIEKIRERIVVFDELNVKMALEDLNEMRWHVFIHNIISILREEPQPLPRLNWDEIHEITYLFEQIIPTNHESMIPAHILHMAKVVLDMRKNKIRKQKSPEPRINNQCTIYPIA